MALPAPHAGNKLMFGAGQFKVMIVGGPNQREDYHIEEGEELFWMIRGDMSLPIIERGARRVVRIREGEVFLLPGRIPHSPQREADTVGLVLERERLPGEQDGLRWYVPGEEGTRVLHQAWLHCVDLGSQLKPVIEEYFASEAHRTKIPAREYTDADHEVEQDVTTAVPAPRALIPWAESALRDALARDGSTSTVLYDGGATREFHMEAFCGDCPAWSSPEGRACAGEVYLHQLRGEAHVTIIGEGEAQRVPAGSCMLVPRGKRVRVQWGEAGGPEATLGVIVTCGKLVE